jgi:hypothetical protein
MFDKKYEQRLELWSTFRQSLEASQDPLIDTIDFFRYAPTVSINTDPWDSSTWPNPWELVYENQYCEFSRVLGWCYSLQLTDRFKGSRFEIHIITDNCLSYKYLLFVDNSVLGYEENKVIHKSDLPKNLKSQQTYMMPALQ